MRYNKVGFHVAANCGGCGGIENYWSALGARGIPFTVYSANDDGLLQRAAQHASATLIYRDVAASTFNPADYGKQLSVTASAYWTNTISRLPPWVKNNRGRVWIELLNEPGNAPEQAAYIGALMFYMGRMALADGYRIMGPGWASGNPEPEAWETAGWRDYFQLCADNPGRAALSLHEYSLNDDIHHMEPWLVGRFRQVYAACGRLSVPVPPIYITECGWTLNSMPPDEQAKRDILYLSALYEPYPEIQCAALWTLQSGAGNGNLPARLNALMPWLTEYSVSVYDPDTDPPPPTGDNLLVNPSFEDGWTDATTFPGQHPTGWRVEWNVGPTFENPHSEYQYELGEGVHKSKMMLPASERDVFIWDGQWTYKVFAGQKCIWARLKQSVELPAGRYELATPVWVDCYRWNGFKDYGVEPWQAETMVKANGTTVRDWSLMVSGAKAVTVTSIDHAGGALDLAVHLRCNWPISNNLWLDGWSLRAVTSPPPDPPPDPPKHKVIVVKFAQNETLANVLKAMEATYPNRHTATYSHGDMLTMLEGGNADSYVKLVRPALQPGVAALLAQEGYRWEPLLAAPLDGVTFGHILPYRYRITSPFNAPRNYANGLHEGVDYDVEGGLANNTTDVLAVYNGVVERVVEATIGYGKSVRIKHDGPYGSTFYTRYAHLDRIYVRQGQQVTKGTPVGEIGQTGNVTGEHVHLNIEIPGHGLSGYAVADVIDPTPFIPSGATLPLVGTAIDTLPYLQGDGRIYGMTVHWQGQIHHPQMQTQVDGGRFYLVKNNEWEELWADSAHIYRGADTSPGDGKYYVQYTDALTYGAKWCPRYWQIGALYERNPLVVLREKATGREVSRGNHRTWLKFVARHAEYKPVPEAIPFSDVIEFTWLTKLDAAPTEFYFYARGVGLVGWSSATGDRSFVSAVYAPGERSPAVRERVAGL